MLGERCSFSGCPDGLRTVLFEILGTGGGHHGDIQVIGDSLHDHYKIRVAVVVLGSIVQRVGGKQRVHLEAAGQEATDHVDDGIVSDDVVVLAHWAGEAVEPVVECQLGPFAVAALHDQVATS
jgi:hypothetical protein